MKAVKIARILEGKSQDLKSTADQMRQTHVKIGLDPDKGQFDPTTYASICLTIADTFDSLAAEIRQEDK